MKTKVQKWGNSLALRIPKAFADEVGLNSDTPIEITLINGQIVIIPFAEEELNLDDLLAQVTDENKHQEIGTGNPVGNEVW